MPETSIREHTREGTLRINCAGWTEQVTHVGRNCCVWRHPRGLLQNYEPQVQGSISLPPATEPETITKSKLLHLPRKVDLKPQKHEDSLALATKSVKHQVQTRAHMCAPQQERRLETAGLSCEACVWENHLQIHQASHLQFDELVPSHRSMWKATTGRSQTQSHHGI